MIAGAALAARRFIIQPTVIDAGKFKRKRNRSLSRTLPPDLSTLKEATMNKEHVKGAADKAKGAVKDAAGKLTGDKGLQAEGKFDKAKGAAHKAVGDVKDVVRGVKRGAEDDQIIDDE
jgi:uncharacterized protein YjbJ (UPF0337 family)